MQLYNFLSGCQNNKLCPIVFLRTEQYREQTLFRMPGNTFGQCFRITTFGESHGPFIGVVIEGVQPNIPIDVEQIYAELCRRRPGQSGWVTQRQEQDRPWIISGIFEGKTTGTPICILIKNQDARPKDYRHLARILRPGHAGFSYLQKYGIYDYRGGGRASGRETAARVAAGAIAKQMLARHGITITGFVRQIGTIRAEEVIPDYIERNPLRAPNPEAASAMEATVAAIRDAGDSIGGIVEIWIDGCPPGLGEPVFEKLEADLGAALLSIGAVKGVEFGEGFAAAVQRGSEHNDPWTFDPETQQFRMVTNHAGGILGGISTGNRIVIRLAVKPPSSIQKPQQTVDLAGKPVTFQTGGRHDPCICPRIVPVAEAMVALVLIDHLLIQSQRSPQQFAVSMLHTLVDMQLLLLLALRLRLETHHHLPPSVSTDLLKSFAEAFHLSPQDLQQLACRLFSHSTNSEEHPFLPFGKSTGQQ